jgi:hypothetical protein
MLANIKLRIISFGNDKLFNLSYKGASYSQKLVSFTLFQNKQVRLTLSQAGAHPSGAYCVLPSLMFDSEKHTSLLCPCIFL